MNEEKQYSNNDNFMIKVATFIVDKRNLFFLIFGILMVFCAVSSSWVLVENSLAEYLPASAETTIGMDLMDEEFVTYGTADFMVMNLDYQEAELLSKKMEDLPSVSMVTFDDTPDHFNNFSALFSVTFRFPESDDRCLDGIEEVKDLIAGSDYYVSTTLGDQKAETIAAEMKVVSAIVVVIVLTVLILTSQTFAEVPVLVLTFGASALLASGTNFFLGTISFVSDSVTIVLQLALSIDYAVIFCNRYKEEHKNLGIREATIVALSKAIPEISSSSLTTIGGLIAMMFMQFMLGMDMAICLIKAILLSLVSVFLLMPGLLMLFGEAMDKTVHKNFIPDIPFVGEFAYKTKKVVPFIFVGVIVVAYIIQKQCPFTYGYSLLETPIQSEQQITDALIDESFGKKNMVALVMPQGDYDKERQLLDYLDSLPEVDHTQGLSNTEAKDGYCLTDKLSAREFSELVELDYNMAELIYAAYAVNDENYGKLIAGISTYKVPLIDMLFFCHDEEDEGYVTIDDSVKADLNEAYDKMKIAKDQLHSDNCNRALIFLALPEEGDETFAFIDRLHTIAREYFPDAEILVAGETTSQYDLFKTFSIDNTVVTVVSILVVLAVLLFTFQSAGMPVLLIVVIQGAIFINFAFPAIMQKNLFFLSYLIVSSIQMGANIDYAIVISGRFMELKDKMPKKQAIIETMNFAFPTIITSGTILALAGILIGQLSSDGAICGIGQCLGRGTIISIFIVMFVLPQILLLGEAIIEKTSFSVSGALPNIQTKGLVRVDGICRGKVDGFMVGEFHGYITGDANMAVRIGSIRELKSAEDEFLTKAMNGEFDENQQETGSDEVKENEVFEPEIDTAVEGGENHEA